ncbi:MAG: YkgJ family cysteine cluster protein [Thermodesulfobacteriota bacterium]
MTRNLCGTCGACCAFFRVLFPSCEISSRKSNPVPSHMTHKYDSTQTSMDGTELKIPKCIALKGNVGFKVSCSIYDNRPSTCRKFERSWENDTGNMLCDRARIAYGLQPFSQY